MFRSLVYELPSQNRVLLQYLLSLLKRVVDNVEKTKVDIAKMAKIFGPILLKPRVGLSASSNQYHLVLDTLIVEYSSIYLVSERQHLN